MKIVNLTPHDIKLNDGTIFPASGQVARVKTSYAEIKNVDGVPFTNTEFGEVQGLPEPQEGTMYIVSGLVKSVPVLSGRTDLCTPCTNHPATKRDINGQIISVPCLSM